MNRQQESTSNELFKIDQFQVMDVEQLREMMMAVHYQGGVDINPDNMSYEELLQLE